MAPSPEHSPPEPLPSDPLEVQLARQLDPNATGRVPRLFSGRRGLGLSTFVDQAIRILHDEQPATSFVVFSPSHPQGILDALAEALEALYPTLTRRRLRHLPPPSWSSTARLAMNEDARGPVGRVLVIDPFEDVWDAGVSDSDRMVFLQNIATLCHHEATTVLLVMDSTRIDHCQQCRLLQPCLNSRFHLRLAPAPPAPVRPIPPPRGDFLPLQPIRPRKTRPNLRDPIRDRPPVEDVEPSPGPLWKPAPGG